MECLLYCVLLPCAYLPLGSQLSEGSCYGVLTPTAYRYLFTRLLVLVALVGLYASLLTIHDFQGSLAYNIFCTTSPPSKSLCRSVGYRILDAALVEVLSFFDA